MLAKSFTCPKCGTKSSVQKIEKNNFACINSRCDLHDRLLAHVDLSANGKVTNVYGWLLERGTILGQRYLIEKLLGKGGFGATYLARDRKMFDKICAIKEIPLRYFDEQEEEFLARLDHPAIPKLIERFNIKGLHYSVMEYFEGTGLDSMVKKSGSGLPESTVFKIAEPLFNVLSYIHSQKVIHRDLKPENILVGKNNSIALIDFGIAKQYDVGKGTRRLARAASCYYSSPEQYQAGKGYTDVKSDIYSFGAILYFLLTGKEPVDALSRTASRDIAPKPRDLNSKISAHVEKVIIKAMKMRKQDRYTSIPQMKKALFRKKTRTAQKCHKCGITLKEPGNFCPNCGHSTNQLSKKPLETFVFRSGDRASTIQEFVENCYTHWEDAKWHLQRGDFIDWLAKQEEKTLLRKARQYKKRKTDPDILLNDFLTASKFGMPPQIKVKQSKFEFQKVAQGHLINASIKISNPGKGLLKGEIKCSENWLKLNNRNFSCRGQENCQIGFTIETEKLEPERIYHTNISLDSNIEQRDIPVTVSVVLPPTQLKTDPAKLYLQLKPGKSTHVELTVKNSGNRKALNWQAEANQDWIKLHPKRFRAREKKIRVEIFTKNLSEGKYNGQIRIASHGKVLTVQVTLLVTSAARTGRSSRTRQPLSQEILRPVFFMLIAALIIGHFGADSQSEPGVSWQVLLLGAAGGYWGIRQNLLKTILGVSVGIFIGYFWTLGLNHLYRFIAHYLMTPLYQAMSLKLSSQLSIFSWGLLGLYLGGIIALMRICAVHRRLWTYFLLGLLGFTIFIGMAFLGLPYLGSG